jgi:hypothetical protein
MKSKTAVTLTFALAIFAACLVILPVSAHAPSGAIFTTLSDGSEVNTNQFFDKRDVYLDGGPGPGAPQTAAGLDDGTYVFQVTDPSGKTLLSTDPARCRQFTVANGIITGVVAQFDGCEHQTGHDIDHDATTVQLFPFDDTPNPGGVYKAWVTFAEDYACDLTTDTVDCSEGAKHGFTPSHTKTDNFKVKVVPIREIDTFFLAPNTGEHLSGLGVTWVDTLGVSNRKWSYYVTFWNVIEAHVEAVEDGDHYIEVENQPGCTVGEIYLRHETQDYTKITETFVGYGPQAVPVKVNNPQAQNWFVKVYCQP